MGSLASAIRLNLMAKMVPLTLKRRAGPPRPEFAAVFAGGGPSGRAAKWGLRLPSIDEALDFRQSAVQMDAIARINCFPSVDLGEIGTKARLRPEAARVHRR